MALVLALVLTVSGLATVKAEARENVRQDFDDITDPERYYYEAVYWAAGRGITNGRSGANLFDPSATCTRREVVTFLWRMAGRPEPSSLESPFTDVTNPEAYYYKAVLWAAETGITVGRASTNYTTFDPNAPCRRGEVVTFLWRYAKWPPASETGTLTDVTDPEDYYYTAIYWALENRITYGRAATNYTTFDPMDECSRAMIVSFLYRYARYVGSSLYWWGADSAGNAGHGYTGFAISSDGSVYYNVDGWCSGETKTVKTSSNYYVLKNGQLRGGWHTIDGENYVLNRNTWILQTSKTVDQIYVDRYGRAEKTDYSAEKIPVMMRARELMLEICVEGDTLENNERRVMTYTGSFMYMLKGIPQAKYMALHACYPAYTANHILNAWGDQSTIGGHCVSEASASGFVFRELGEERDIYLKIAYSGHAWLQIGDDVCTDPYYYARYGESWLNRSLPYPGTAVYTFLI